jgi:polyhydroxyalkanoate synthesis regulator phasin
MDSQNLTDLLQQGLRVTLGATASLIEILQDPQKRDENLNKLKTDLSQLADEWAKKGSLTEQEARSFVDTLLEQRQHNTPSDVPSSETTATDSTPTASPDIQLGLQELTAQIAAIRAELENLRDPNPPV